MKFRTNKIIQKIAIVLICLLMFNFIAPTYVSNADVGGVLFSPIKALILTVGDVAMHMIEFSFYGKLTDVVLDDFCGWKNEDKDYNMWDGTDHKDVITYPVIKLSPEMIFANKVELFNINFISELNEDDYEVKSADTTSSIKALRENISSWYVAIRNLSLVAMLSILIYVGIKIIISSAAQDKAKYKQMLIDWIVGICLLFMLHYIMAFTLKVTELITDMVSKNTVGSIKLVDPRDSSKELILEAKEDSKEASVTGTDYGIKEGAEVTTVGNLTSYVRLYTNLYDVSQSFGYIVIYLFIIFYTVVFCVIYIKRMITVAFLTVIAPFVAMTYPLDKMSDGKAQAFNFWLKEYIYNALIQVFHLILWSLLVGSAIDLVKTNLIYAIVVMACMKPAEKLLKEMFGMNSRTAPGFAGMAAPAFATAMANKLTGGAKGVLKGSRNGSNGSNGSVGNGGDNSPQIPQRTRTRDYNFDSINAESMAHLDDEMLDSGATTGVAAGAAAGASAASDEEMSMPQDNSANELLYEQQRALQNDSEMRRQLDNNQNAELDAYLNSPAYSNGSGEGNDSNSNINSNISSNSNQPQRLSTLSKVGRIGKHAVKKISKPKNLGKALRFSAKTAARVGGGVLGASAGLVAGSLTGNPGMAFSGMVAGATKGNQLGGRSVDGAISAARKIRTVSRDTLDAGTNFKNEALYGQQYAYEQQLEREEKNQMKDYMKDSSNVEFFEQKTGASKTEMKEIMANAADFNQMGAKDNEEILKAMELEKIYKEDNKMDDAQAHQLAGISAKMMSEEGYKAADFADEKKRKAIENRTATIVKEYGGNLNEKQQEQLAKQIMSGNEYMAEVRKRQKDKMNYRDNRKNSNKGTKREVKKNTRNKK